MRTPRRRAVLHAVDELLCVLDAHADGKRLCLHDDARLMQHSIRIARRVSDAEKDCLRRNTFRVAHVQCHNAILMQLHTRHLRTEAHLTAQRNDFFAQILHHGPQNIRPDVRLLQIANFFGRTRRDKRLDDLAHARIIAACRQLSIRKGPRAALAELHIRRRIKRACLPETCHIRRTPVHILSAFENKRRESRTRKQPRGKDPRGTKSDHNGTMLSQCPRLRDHQRLLARCRHNLLVPTKAREHRMLILHISIQHIDPNEGRTMPAPCIQCLMNNNHPAHGTG